MPMPPATTLPADLTVAAPGNPAFGGAPSAKLDMRSLGATGLSQFGGHLSGTSAIKELEGKKGLEIFREMAQTEAACVSVTFVIEHLIRQVPWRVTPASTAEFDLDAAEFLETAMYDMEGTWSNFVAEHFKTMLTYGHSIAEVVYKRRAGDSPQGHLNSQYADGRVGWRDLASRSPRTVYRWIYDDNGRLLGLEQQAPPRYRVTYLPMSKCIHFRTAVEEGSPLGVSIFRGAYRSWYYKTGLEALEAVGAEKDLNGMPVVGIPLEILQAAEDGDDKAKAIVDSYYKLATNIRIDKQSGIVMPVAYDDKGNEMFKLSLMGSAGSKQYNAHDIIKRHEDNIYRSVAADFIALGGSSGGAGSYAMISDKTDLFLKSLRSLLVTFAESLNKQAVAPLMKLNGFEMSAPPKIEVGSLDKIDATQLADVLLKFSQAGMSLFPDPELENFVRDAAGLPQRVEQEEDTSNIIPQPGIDDGPEKELHDPATPVPLPEARHQAALSNDPDAAAPKEAPIWHAPPALR